MNKEPNFKKDYTSDFNEAQFQIQRIHELYHKCHNYSENGNLIKLRWVLDRIWLELANDARVLEGEEEKDNKYFIKLKDLDGKISKCKNKVEFYGLLKEKEMFLRFLQDDAGKGSKRSDKDEEDFD